MLRGLVLVACFIAALGAANYVVFALYPAHIWADAAYQADECGAAAEIASQIMSTRPLVGSHSRALAFSFDPKLLPARATLALDPRRPWFEGFSKEALARTVPGLRLRASQAPELDCTAAFKRAGLPTQHLKLVPPTRPDGPWPANYSFTRIWLSSDRKEAGVLIEMFCGNLCGYGNYIVWRKTDDRWRMISDTPLWVS